MKQFIIDLKSEWSPVKNFSTYKYSGSNFRHFIRRVVATLNREMSTIVLHLLNNPLSVVVLLSSIIAAISLANFMDNSAIKDLLGSISGFIVSFISVLVAAAIFISTLHRQSASKTADEDIKFQEAITDNKGTLSRVYEICYSVASDEEKVKLFKSTPCDAVTEYQDYEKYKKWHQDYIATLEDTHIESYESYLKYPYNTAMSVTWNRAYFMADGCEVAIALLDRIKDKDLKSAVKELLVASKRNQVTGSGGYYVPTEFVGQRLYRVVVYSLFALLMILFYAALGEYKWDLIPEVYFHTPVILFVLAAFSTVISLYLILRYVFKFFSYLRDSTSYYSNSHHSLYIHEPDPDMHDPSNSYGI